MRSSARVIGWTLPGSTSRPGRVMSMRSAARRRSKAASSSAALRAAMASCSRSLMRLTRTPCALRSPGGSLPSAFNCSVTRPDLPSSATRKDSSASSDAAPSMSASACAICDSSDCVIFRLCKKTKGSAALAGSPSINRRKCESCGHGGPQRDSRQPGRWRQRLREAGFRLLRDRAERLEVVHGEIREHLAVDGDAGLLQAVHQPAVGQAELARRGVDAHDPQRAELALLLLAADVGVLHRLDDRLLGDAEHLASGVVVALRAAEDLLVPTARDDTTFDSCHGSSPSDVGQHAGDAAGIFLPHDVRTAKIAFALGALLGQDVALERMAGLELAGCGLAEPLGGGPIGLDLGHDPTPFS